MLARVFLLATVVDAWVCNLVLEESLVVVPGHGRFLARALRSRVRVGVGGCACLDGRVRLFVEFGLVRHQSEVETCERRRALGGQLFADALLLLEAVYLVAARAAVLLDERLALVGERGVVHEGSVGVLGGLREREEVGRDVARVLLGQTEVRHDRAGRSEEHTSELQSLAYLVCRLLLEKKKKHHTRSTCSSNTDNSCHYVILPY